MFKRVHAIIWKDENDIVQSSSRIGGSLGRRLGYDKVGRKEAREAFERECVGKDIKEKEKKRNSEREYEMRNGLVGQLYGVRTSRAGHEDVDQNENEIGRTTSRRDQTAIERTARTACRKKLQKTGKNVEANTLLYCYGRRALR